jgi:hypothetical protein
MLAEVGEMVTDAVRATSVLPEHAASRPANATTASTRATRARGASACRVRPMMTLFIELLLT